MTDPLRPNADEAARAWSERVRANREQVERFREAPDGDFYGPISGAFRDDPRRTGDATLDALLTLARSDETWLDIGAGGGRYALPLALHTKEVIAVEPSEGMRDVLRGAAHEHGVGNIREVAERWPGPGDVEADVSLIANVGMDIEDFGGFVDAMEAATRRMCVAVMPYRQPTFLFDRVWPQVHGEARATLPSLPEFLVLLLSRDRIFELTMVERPPMAHESPDNILAFLRRQTWVTPGGEKDQKLQEIVTDSVEERDGRYALSWEPVRVGIIRWAPR